MQDERPVVLSNNPVYEKRYIEDAARDRCELSRAVLNEPLRHQTLRLPGEWA
ncbi:hypothetical protein [Erwinia sp. HR93]|uniref:hypothetical protein n=1 Tax=Erwinia sp. HR93 TaxID=3094840 RepID=UPI002ADECB4F|nr:hypothetical protein [Erwinia sp. HR93]MEA1065279.1 hypothetical protein [Erwinia sp. HR93]